jgi:xanthine dehydrogenase accessory factor
MKGKRYTVNRNVVIVRGGGDMGTGVAHKLHRSGFQVLILEMGKPLVIRRKVAFAQAVIDGRITVEGVKAVRVNAKKDIVALWKQGKVPIVVDPQGNMIREVKAEVVIDATLAKRNTGMHRDMAPITIALGPGFRAGKDVDVVIETNRGHNLGRLIFKGYAEPNTGIPGPIKGYTEERVLRAPCDGKIRTVLDIGGYVKKRDVICYCGKEPVRAEIDGVIRGLIMNTMEVKKGFKIGDIDPRGIREYCTTISDKARAIGGAVLEAILYMKRVKKT